MCVVPAGAGWPGGLWLRFCAGETGQEWAGAQQPLNIHLSGWEARRAVEAEARQCPLSQAGLGLFSRTSLHRFSQSHMVMAAPSPLAQNLGGV